MPRPRKPCCVACHPGAAYFKPRGIPLRLLDEVVLPLDGFEALRLADFEGLSQEEGAERMGVSRATFGRIVEAARRVVADALLHGKALRIEGGEVILTQRMFRCPDCGHSWSVDFGADRPDVCPQCKSANLHRAEEERGWGRRGRRGGFSSGGGRGMGQGGGKGKGRMGGPLRAGPGGQCLCPQCGHRTPHAAGEPCSEKVCPKCGTAMTRE